MSKIIDSIVPAIMCAVICVLTWPYVARAVEDYMVESTMDKVVHADYVEGEKSSDLITPEVKAAASAMMGEENAASFLHALQLNMTRYDMDMMYQNGRKKWHGSLISEEVYTNELVKVEVYSNEVSGAVWRYKLPFTPKPLKSTKRKTSYTTNGIPARLAEARARRVAQINGGSVITNIDWTANTLNE